MMQTVHKYELPWPGEGIREIPMPIGAVPIYVDKKHNKPFIWCIVDDTAQLVSKSFLMTGTGEEIPESANHAGSFMDEVSTHVYHVWEL
jgi:hypothetical protein